MTSQPTPGEVLNGESVRLLLPGDVLEAVEATCSFAVGERVVVESLQEWGSYLEVSVSGLSWMPSRFTFVSRPQPSGGQDGGGKADRLDAVADWLLTDEYWDAADTMLDQITVNAMRAGAASIRQALASPAKATGWPSREDVVEAIRDTQVSVKPFPVDFGERLMPFIAEEDAAKSADAILALFPTIPTKAETHAE